MSTSNAKPVAFIAGATGYTGRAVVQACVAAGLRTVAHVRPDSSQRAEWEQRFKSWGAEPDATPWEPAAMNARFAELQPDYVFALLGTTTKRARREGITDRYMKIDYGLTAMLIDAAAPLKQPRFVYLSAAGVGPNRGAYIEARFLAEQKLRASGLPFIIARPGLITGDREESRPAETIAAAVLRPMAAMLRVVGARRVAAWVSVISGTQLGQALVREALAAKSADIELQPVDLLA
jgi:nucleoside-diphosphate-sugar epimerase